MREAWLAKRLLERAIGAGDCHPIRQVTRAKPCLEHRPGDIGCRVCKILRGIIPVHGLLPVRRVVLFDDRPAGAE